jgi:hypothetical protein
VAPVVLQTMHREIIAPRKLGNNGAIIPVEWVQQSADLFGQFMDGIHAASGVD